MQTSDAVEKNELPHQLREADAFLLRNADPADAAVGFDMEQRQHAGGAEFVLDLAQRCEEFRPRPDLPVLRADGRHGRDAHRLDLVEEIPPRLRLAGPKPFDNLDLAEPQDVVSHKQILTRPSRTRLGGEGTSERGFPGPVPTGDNAPFLGPLTPRSPRSRSC